MRPPLPTDNALLACLPAAAREALLESLESVELRHDEVIHESGAPLRCLLFPTTAIVSVCYVLAGGQSSEIGVIGNDGVVGIALFMGGNTMPNRASVRGAGHAFRLDPHGLQREFARGRHFHDVLLRYTQALMTQMLQTSVCNNHHAVDQRLCRWLLLTLDRSRTNTISITQEHISRMLGVRRESITEAMRNLQASDLVEARRGQLRIIDRSGLEVRVCECYRVVKDETARLFPNS